METAERARHKRLDGPVRKAARLLVPVVSDLVAHDPRTSGISIHRVSISSPPSREGKADSRGYRYLKKLSYSRYSCFTIVANPKKSSDFICRRIAASVPKIPSTYRSMSKYVREE